MIDKNEAGFTLVEVLIVIAVIAFMMLGISKAIYVAEQSATNNTVTNAAFETANFAMEMLTRDLRQATGNNLVAGANTLTFDIGTPPTTYTYTLTNGNLWRNNALLASNVTQFTPTITAGSTNAVVNITLSVVVNGKTVQLKDSVTYRSASGNIYQ